MFVFLVYFMNYGVVYLMAPMMIQIPILSIYFEGIYPDFNTNWFQDIGGLIIFVAIINAIIPPIMLASDWLLMNILRSID